MSYKSILVHVDNSRACAARLAVAINLAREFGAHLTGLYLMPGLTVPPPYIVAEVGPDLMQAQEEAAAARAEEAREAFEAATRGTSLATEWRTAEGGRARSIELHGRYCDLIVLGQADPEDPACVSGGLADKVVLESGRPVLVVPYIGAQRPLDEYAMVAWNRGREAVRAVNDALPLLQKARKVDVLSINPDPSGENIPSSDICLHLARHGVRAEARHARASDIDVGDMLLSLAADRGVGLLVMGAYGHSRFRELVLGGATKHLLEHMTVPVLMSH